jgi:hypothetical protein
VGSLRRLGPDDDAQQVRVLAEVAGAEADADCGHVERRHRAAGVGELGEDRDPGRCRELDVDRAAVRREVAGREQFEHRRAGHRQDAVGAAHLSAAECDRRHVQPIQPECGESQASADDVDDRVYGTDFVELHGLRRDAVHSRLGRSQPPEDRGSPIPDRRDECGAIDEFEEVGEPPMWLFAARRHVDGDAAQPAASRRSRPDADAERKRFGERRQVERAQVGERAEQHVAAHPGAGVDPAGRCHRAGFIRLGGRPARRRHRPRNRCRC